LQRLRKSWHPTTYCTAVSIAWKNKSVTQSATGFINLKIGKHYEKFHVKLQLPGITDQISTFHTDMSDHLTNGWLKITHMHASADSELKLRSATHQYHTNEKAWQWNRKTYYAQNLNKIKTLHLVYKTCQRENTCYTWFGMCRKCGMNFLTMFMSACLIKLHKCWCVFVQQQYVYPAYSFTCLTWKIRTFTSQSIMS
jgi:hypothetical protein